MLASNKHTTISKEVSTHNELDYSFLRTTGIAYLEKFSGKLWTDYNSHDPGITLLELLSYAITDLGARINLPIEDVLANNESQGLKQFYEAHEILPTHPVTDLDYRKLFIDVKGVRNAWMMKYDHRIYVDCENDTMDYVPFDLPEDKKHCFKVKGLYRILIDFETFNEKEFPTPTKIKKERERIENEIRCLYHTNRNLCEDLVDIKEVPKQNIGVCMEVELHPEVDEELVNAKIIYAIQHYFSPNVHFHTLQEMLEDKIPTEEIFDGPLLSHGFIKADELQKADLRREVRLSDLINTISDIEGVKIIKDISINHCGAKSDEASDEWRICIKEGHKPMLCDESVYSFFKDVLPVNINKTKVQDYLNEFYENNQQLKKQLMSAEKTLKVKKGEHLALDEYSSVVNDLPLVYGVGEIGLPKSASEARKAQAKQLKGYLLFFDQILANYMKQLQGVKELLAIKTPLTSTFLAQQVQDMPNLEELLVTDYFAHSDSDFSAWLYKNLTNSKEKVAQILDHLLARFAENFGEYAFLMKQLYGENIQDQVTQTKMNFIHHYAHNSYHRGLGFNYCCDKESLWNSDNVSYFEKRLALLIGMPNIARRNLSTDSLQMYSESTSSGVQPRWRMLNSKGDIIKSSTKFYSSEEQMYAELLLVKQLGVKKENYEIRLAGKTKFYIVLVDKTQNPKSEAYVIARRYSYFTKKENAKKMVLKIISELQAMVNNEGLFLIENILLLPEIVNQKVDSKYFLPICTDHCKTCEEIDPYSYRVTIVLPGWTERFANMDFRNFMENLIRKELPAHVMARICWVGYPQNHPLLKENKLHNDMHVLEMAYRAFLEQKQKNCITKADTKLKSLIESINELNSIYPKGTLIDCNDESDNLAGKVILGRTKI